MLALNPLVLISGYPLKLLNMLHLCYNARNVGSLTLVYMLPLTPLNTKNNILCITMAIYETMKQFVIKLVTC